MRNRLERLTKKYFGREPADSKNSESFEQPESFSRTSQTKLVNGGQMETNGVQNYNDDILGELPAFRKAIDENNSKSVTFDGNSSEPASNSSFDQEKGQKYVSNQKESNSQTDEIYQNVENSPSNMSDVEEEDPYYVNETNISNLNLSALNINQQVENPQEDNVYYSYEDNEPTRRDSLYQNVKDI